MLRRSFALVAALALSWGGMLAAPRPALAAWEATLTIKQLYEVVGDGAGTITSDDGNIDCRWVRGSLTGDCSQSYTFADFLGEVIVILALTPDEHSYGCFDGAAFCGIPPLAYKFVRGSVTSITVSPGFWIESYMVWGAVTGAGGIASNSGKACGPIEGYAFCRMYKYGTTVGLSAVPDAGTNFSYWEGDACSDAARSTACEFTIGGPTQVRAVFGLHRVTLRSEGEGKTCLDSGDAPQCIGGGASESWWRPAKASYRVQASALSGWHFDRWNAGPCAGQDSSCEFTLTDDVDIKVFYVRNATAAAPTASPGATARANATPKPGSTAKTAQTPAATPPPSAPATSGTAASATSGPSGPALTAAPTQGALATAASTPAPVGSPDAVGSPDPIAATPGPTAAPLPAAGGAAGGFDLALLVIVGGVVLALVLGLGYAMGRRGSRRRSVAGDRA